MSQLIPLWEICSPRPSVRGSALHRVELCNILGRACGIWCTTSRLTVVWGRFCSTEVPKIVGWMGSRFWVCVGSALLGLRRVDVAFGRQECVVKLLILFPGGGHQSGTWLISVNENVMASRLHNNSDDASHEYDPIRALALMQRKHLDRCVKT